MHKECTMQKKLFNWNLHATEIARHGFKDTLETDAPKRLALHFKYISSIFYWCENQTL